MARDGSSLRQLNPPSRESARVAARAVQGPPDIRERFLVCRRSFNEPENNIDWYFSRREKKTKVSCQFSNRRPGRGRALYVARFTSSCVCVAPIRPVPVLREFLPHLVPISVCAHVRCAVLPRDHCILTKRSQKRFDVYCDEGKSLYPSLSLFGESNMPNVFENLFERNDRKIAFPFECVLTRARDVSLLRTMARKQERYKETDRSW